MRFKQYYLTEKKNVEYDYSSVQADFNDEIAKKIMDFSAEIPDEYIYNKEDSNEYGREDEIHTTILYGIHDENPDEVKELLKDTKPFEIKFGKISYFELEDEDHDVMKVEIESEELHNLNKLLRDNVEYTNGYPDYKPHCTICYIKKDYPKDEVDEDTFKDLSQTMESITFSSKNGEKTTIGLK